MASSSPVNLYSSYQANPQQETQRTGLVSSVVGSTRSYGTVKDSNSFLSTPHSKNCLLHTVKEGDTLQGLALKYNVTTHQIQGINNLWNSESLFSHYTIKIPLTHSNNSSRSESPSPTMFHSKNIPEVEHTPSEFSEDTRPKSHTVPGYTNVPGEEDEIVRSKLTGRGRYESDITDGSDGVKNISDILSSADEQLRLSREFAEKLAKRSAQRALPEGAYNRTAEMKDYTRQDNSLSASQSSFLDGSLKHKRGQVVQSSEKESASREDIVDQIFEL